MELNYTHLVIFHAACGGIALLAGILAFALKKGKSNHSRAGLIFAIFMALSGLSAIVLTLLKPNPFLMAIGFFTLYMIGSGWVWIRRTAFQRKIRIARMVGISGIIITGYMVFTAISSQKISIVLLVFAGILLIMSATDIFRKPKPKDTAALHGGRMGGAFIAALTAFLVVNNDFLPPLVAWLGPTVVVSPIIALTIRKYYRRSKVEK